MNKNRQSIRLKNYDYSKSGYYFVTICTQNRECILGNITNNNVGVGRDQPISMILNQYGKIIENVWKSLPNHHPVKLDAFQIMPNHIHGIIIIKKYSPVGVSFMKPDVKILIAKSNHHMGLINQTPTLGLIIRYFKSKCTYEIHKNGFNNEIFQRNYYEHIIRTENNLNKIREYIINNPLMWDRDRNNPKFNTVSHIYL